MNQADVYYQAMLARDPRFDGKFFVGVKTTGIYCRPICPARPKRINVEFFKNHLIAEKAGYRPCLRCRPESAPQSPAWIGTSAIVQRAVKVLQTQYAQSFKEDDFAEQFGVSARHLRRLFIDEIGKTPKQLCFENRLNLARKLIVETRLPIAEIGFASGFHSVRRFNDSFKDRFKKSPKEIRRNSLAPNAPLLVSLPYRPPFDFSGLLYFYKNHQVGNLERFDSERMYRIIEYDGKVGQIIISNDPENSNVLVEIDFPDTSHLHVIIANVRILLDLDSDPVLIANSLEANTRVKALLQKHPGIRLPSGWSQFEVAVATILGQLVSVEQGRSLVNQLIELLGKDSGLTYAGQPIRLFPTPIAIASADLSGLKTTGARKETLKQFAKAIANKQLSLEPTQDVGEFVDKVMDIRGIGPWTANYMALKVLRHTDAFPATDLILNRALALHSQEVVDKMSPWRGYAAALFWRVYTQDLKKTRRKKS